MPPAGCLEKCPHVRRNGSEPQYWQADFPGDCQVFSAQAKELVQEATQAVAFANTIKGGACNEPHGAAALGCPSEQSSASQIDPVQTVVRQEPPPGPFYARYPVTVVS